MVTLPAVTNTLTTVYIRVTRVWWGRAWPRVVVKTVEVHQERQLAGYVRLVNEDVQPGWLSVALQLPSQWAAAPGAQLRVASSVGADQPFDLSERPQTDVMLSASSHGTTPVQVLPGESLWVLLHAKVPLAAVSEGDVVMVQGSTSLPVPLAGAPAQATASLLACSYVYFNVTLNATDAPLAAVRTNDLSGDIPFAVAMPNERATLDDTVRLVGGSSPYEGIVEVYFIDKWVRLCAWATPEVIADVVCRQLLGPSSTYRQTRFAYEAGFTTTVEPSYSLFTRCRGSTVQSCMFDYPYDDSCLVDESYALFCNPPAEKLPSVPQEESLTPSVLKLEGGSGRRGLLMSFADGHWRGVCQWDHDWDARIARVACRQMYGLGSVPLVSRVDSQDFNTTGLEFFIELSCTGHEETLQSCGHDFSSSCAGSWSVVALWCSNPANDGRAISALLSINSTATKRTVLIAVANDGDDSTKYSLAAKGSSTESGQHNGTDTGGAGQQAGPGASGAAIGGGTAAAVVVIIVVIVFFRRRGSSRSGARDEGYAGMDDSEASRRESLLEMPDVVISTDAKPVTDSAYAPPSLPTGEDDSVVV
eukprot:PLAT12497.2.p1 GENE.PLAT12497.2~~PLAT12497.2.p1  ORF type:complete len:589 (-),score=110.04 PLAT12497.2:144-1910(-)